MNTLADPAETTRNTDPSATENCTTSYGVRRARYPRDARTEPHGAAGRTPLGTR